MPTYKGLKAKATKLLQGKFNSTIDTFNQLTTAEYTPILEIRPLPGISKQRDIVLPEGGNVSVVDGEIVIDGTAETTSLYSRKRGRYQPGTMGLVGIGVRIPNESVGQYEFGYGDSIGNRFGLEVNDGEWYTFIESAGVRYYRNPRSNWEDPLDGTGPSGINLDATEGFVLRCPFGWYGYLSIEFNIVVAGPVTDKIVRIDHSGHDIQGVSIVQPDLPVFAEATGGALHVGGRQYGIYGRYNPVFRITSPELVTKTVGNTFEPVVSFQFKSASQWQGISVFLDSVSLITDSNIEYAVYSDVDLVDGTFTSMSSIDPTETILEINTGATDFSGGFKLYSDLQIAGRGSAQGSGNKALSDITVPSGSIVTIVARALDTSSTVSLILRFREEW